MPIVQFTPFSSLVQPSLWHKLSALKIDVLKLSDDALPLTGSYTAGRTVRDRESDKDVALGCHLTVGAEGFDSEHKSPPGYIPTMGSIKNFNTIEDFKNADKTALFNQEATQIWDAIQKNDLSQLNRFLVITYADIKKFKFYYWFTFPAFASKPAWELSEDWKVLEKDVAESVQAQYANQPYFLLANKKLGRVEDYDTFFANVPAEEQIVGFLDPSADPISPGWPLRNLLAYLHFRYPNTTHTVRVLRWRGTDSTPLIGTLSIGPGASSDSRPTAVGWEKNPQGKLGPRAADLAPMMDPRRLAEQAVDLNLKLMRWRILPSLDLEKIASARCLLLGAGTLGCYVARGLMGWGVRQITFVDSSTVSFSNPVRQPLFEFEDCLDGGKPKAEAAAAALRRISPGIVAKGVQLSIPMPGHPIPNNPISLRQAQESVKTLEDLIDSHDAVFLLMDSRESRWLPTVIGASKNKIVLNAALGFDTYLVMRHGARASTVGDGQRLGCYYCNDIVAPADSLTDRTLDQMCTVTRPGLAPIAAASAVELLASILQHPDGLRAPAPPAGSTASQDDGNFNSVLGHVPHQLRGFLAQFRTMPLVGAGYDRCTGCSEVVLKAYETQGFEMLLQAFNDTKYLEKLAGLDKLFAEGEDALEAVEWEEDGEDDF